MTSPEIQLTAVCVWESMLEVVRSLEAEKLLYHQTLLRWLPVAPYLFKHVM